MIDQNKIDEILKKFDLMQNNLNEEKIVKNIFYFQNFQTSPQLPKQLKF